MTDFEVPEAIICSPFEEPAHYWRLEVEEVRRALDGFRAVSKAIETAS